MLNIACAPAGATRSEPRSVVVRAGEMPEKDVAAEARSARS